MLVRRLKDLLGPGGWVADAEVAGRMSRDERGLYAGVPLLVARPGSTAEVAELVRLCAADGVAVVPQGGNTGLVGGAVPPEGQDSVLVSLGRMNRLRRIDADNHAMAVDAGMILADAQAAAEAAGRLFPLSLSAEGTCQVGGNISTNAGGIQVLRYGTMRELVLGLEAVLPDGTVWDGMTALRKDNTGYDLKQLFIGAEGTLGIVTGAVLKLFPRPAAVTTAFVALPSAEAAVTLYALARDQTEDRLTAFELISRYALEAGMRHVGFADPLSVPAPWYGLIDCSGRDGRAVLEGLLEQALECGLVTDGTVAASVAQARALWRMREATWPAQAGEGASIKHDISLPVSAVPGFLSVMTPRLEAAVPGARVFAFGHVGDGNLHYNLAQAGVTDAERFMARTHEINALVHDLVQELGGSISAEHGIGRLKRAELAGRHPAKVALMRSVKAALDPQGIMNPGVLPV